MVAIAGSARRLRVLPWLLSVPLAATVFGVIVLGGMQLPLVTRGGGVRRWLPWGLWSIALATCPVAITTVGALYPHMGPSAVGWERQRAARMVERLVFTQLGISAICSVTVVMLTRGAYRWLAWAAILAVLVVTALLCVIAQLRIAYL